MEALPEVSFVITTFKTQRRWLETALEDCCAQEFDNIEVIVSDDGPDRTAARVVDDIGDPRIRYFRNDRSLGPAENYRSGFARARGRYLSPFDHDDRRDPTFLRRLTEPLVRDPSFVASFCDHWIVNDAYEIQIHSTEACTRRWGRDLLGRGALVDWRAALVNRSLPVGGGCVFENDPSIWEQLGRLTSRHWDLELLYYLWKSGRPVWYEPDRRSSYFVHGESITFLRSGHGGAARCYEAMLREPALQPWSGILGRNAASAWSGSALAAIDEGDRSAARRQARRGVVLAPRCGRGWAVAGLANVPIRVGQLLLSARAMTARGGVGQRTASPAPSEPLLGRKMLAVHIRMRSQVVPRLQMIRYDVRARLRRRALVDPDGLCDVMMTSDGPRLGRAHLALESIGAGSCRPQSLTLAVSDERFVAKPSRVVRRQIRRGLEVVLVPDHQPHTKYYPYVASRTEFRRPLVTADDDKFYARQWLRRLQATHHRHPYDIVTHIASHVLIDDRLAPYMTWPRVTCSDASFLHFPLGMAGTLHPPAQLLALKAAGTAFTDSCLTNDDIWLHVVALRNSIRVRQVSGMTPRRGDIPRRDNVCLFDANHRPDGNDAMIAATYSRNDIKKLMMEASGQRCACRW
jgi:hypothetical protein